MVVHQGNNQEKKSVLLTGHKEPIFTMRFSPNGRSLASGSMDKTIIFWDIEDGSYRNYQFTGHKNAIFQVCWTSDSQNILSCSADKTLALWDLEKGVPKKRMRGHTSLVNSCDTEPSGGNLVCSGSDDGSVRIWDIREKEAIKTFQNIFQITSVCFDLDSERVFGGSLDNIIRCWDIKTDKVIYSIPNHTDTILSLRLNNDGTKLYIKIIFRLSNSEDRTCRIFDIRPFTQNTDRCLHIYQGHESGYEKNLIRACWSSNNNHVACGSSDTYLYIWDVESQKIKYRLPGHTSCLNEVDFHPTKPIIGSCGSDKKIFLGEIRL